MTDRDVIVIGGGAAGVLFVTHLAHAATGPLRVTVMHGPGRPGAGTAYRTTDPAHLLNVRAGALSAWHDQPDHFVGWLGATSRPGRATDELAGQIHFLLNQWESYSLSGTRSHAHNGGLR